MSVQDSSRGAAEASILRGAAVSAALFSLAGLAALFSLLALGASRDASSGLLDFAVDQSLAAGAPYVAKCARGGCAASGLRLDLEADGVDATEVAGSSLSSTAPRQAGLAFVQHAVQRGAIAARARLATAAGVGSGASTSATRPAARPAVALRGAAPLLKEEAFEVASALPNVSAAMNLHREGPPAVASENLSCDALLVPGDHVAAGVPLTVGARVELELLARWGFAPALGACRGRKDVDISVGGHLTNLLQQSLTSFDGEYLHGPHASKNETTAPGVDEGHKASHGGVNAAEEHFRGPRRRAMVVGAVWFAVAAAVMLWSLAGVLAVPAKREDEPRVPAEFARLADEDSAWRRGFLHWVSLGWADSLMGRYGKCPGTTVGDMELVDGHADAEYEPFLRLRRAWDEQIQRAGGVEGASLAWALQKVIGLRACVMLFVAVVVELGMSVVGVVVALDFLLSYLQRVYDPAEQGDYFRILEPTAMVILLCFVLPLMHRAAATVVTLMDGYYTNLCAAGLASLVYEKALLLPVGAGCAAGGGFSSSPRGAKSQRLQPHAAGAGAGQDSTEGTALPNAVQLLNVDIIEASGYLLKSLVHALVAPFIFVALLSLLVVKLRLAGFFGALYVFPVLVVTWFVQMMNIASWKQYQGHQDKRLARLSDAIVQMRAIKALAWERLAFRHVTEAREQELRANFACAVASGCTQANIHSVPWFSLAITLALVGAFQGGVQAWEIFVVYRVMMSLFSMLNVMAFGLHKLVMVPNSLSRIKVFLAQEERPRSLVREPVLDRQALALRVVGSFSFDSAGAAVLKDIDLAIPRGQLVAVIGGMASGKSALLLSMLGELFSKSPRPTIEAPRRTAYCAQTPWIFDGTLRENVTLSQAHEQERYRQVIRAAGLEEDLRLLPGGDLVPLGALGMRLSAGQRARVALARAAYLQEAELVLLDDPLSALDDATANHVFEELLVGDAMRGRTRVVAGAPRDARRLQRFDRVIVLEEGRVAVDGTPDEVLGSAAFARLAKAGAGAPGGFAEPLGAVLQAVTPPGPPAVLPAPLASSAEADDAVEPVEGDVPDRFSWSTMRMWIRAVGGWNLFSFCSILLAQRVLFLIESLVLASWVDSKLQSGTLHSDGNYISTLVLVVSMGCLSFIVLYWAAGRMSFAASRHIHEHMLSALLRAPVDSFFDKQTPGMLLNRFSFDLRFVDNAISYFVMVLFTFVLGFFVVQSYVLAVVPWRSVFLSGPIYLLMFVYAQLYRGTAIPLVFRSKAALSCIQDLQGMVTRCSVSIRANGMRADFMARHNHYSATIIRCQYLTFHVAKAWVQMRVTMCYCSLTVLFVLGGMWKGMRMGTLANIIMLSFMLLSEFEAVAQTFANFITCLNSVQRLARVLDAPQEAPTVRAGDPRLRISVALDRSEMASLEVKGGVSAEASLPDCADPSKSWLYFRTPDGRPGQRTSTAVFLKGGFPVLRASEGGHFLELLHGRRLRDLAPSNAQLRVEEDSYCIVAVNGAARDAGQMAEEMCNPPQTVWLDLWLTKYVAGLSVQVQDLRAGYYGEPSVLRGLSLDIPARSRVGLIGRSGGGKSTLLLCLLRMLETRGGVIIVGGMDTSKLGLAALREIFGIVPQEPVIFGGTLRENLDPYGERPDGLLWDALQSTALLSVVRAMARGLDTELTRDSPGLSAAQQQLLGLARMVVRQPPVLLLDECVSVGDARASAVVRSCLASSFPLSTIVAAAHRAETLHGFTSVAVLEGGVVEKYGPVDQVLHTGARAPG